MQTVYLFWTWAVASSILVLLLSRSKAGTVARGLYRPLTVLAFSLASLLAVLAYIRALLAGNTDFAIVLLIHQGYINPVVHFILELGLIELVERPFLDLPNPKVIGGVGESLALQLWDTIVADFVLGNLFWLVVCELWLRIVDRRLAVGRQAHAQEGFLEL